LSGVVAGNVDLRIRPPAGEPEGALILNHGRATDENDLFGLLDEFDPDRRLLGVTTGAPVRGIPPGGRHWYIVERVGYPHPQTFELSYRLLTESLDHLLAEHALDWSRAVIGGFSQGAVMSYAVALGAGRPLPAGLIALSGFIPEVEGWEPEFAGRGALRTLVHHGALDPVISVAFGRAAASSLRAGGIDAVYIESEAGHSLPPEVIDPARRIINRAIFSATETGAQAQSGG
jgi:phospholipase/carboxylesterase